MNMINHLRTLLARHIVRYLSGPRSLLVAARVCVGLTGGAVGIAALLWLVASCGREGVLVQQYWLGRHVNRGVHL